jgi:hypothetical protein
MSCQACESSAWDRGIIGPFIGPRRYVSERFGVSGERRSTGRVGSGAEPEDRGSVGDQASGNRSNTLARQPLADLLCAVYSIALIITERVELCKGVCTHVYEAQYVDMLLTCGFLYGMIHRAIWPRVVPAMTEIRHCGHRDPRHDDPHAAAAVLILSRRERGRFILWYSVSTRCAEEPR